MKSTACAVVASAFLLALATQADAAIYWAYSPPIGRANLDGTYLETEFIPNDLTIPTQRETFASCGGVAVDGSHIFWADPARNSIGRANLDGTDPNYTFIAGADNPCGVAIDSTHLYWANVTGNSIGRANLDGTEPTQAFIPNVERPCGIAVNNVWLYWSRDGEHGGVGRYLLPTGAVLSGFIKNLDGACGVAVDESHIYWGTFDHEIGRANLDGTDVNPTFIPGLDRPCGVAVYDGHLYWTEQSNPGQIGSANLDGGGVDRGMLSDLGFIGCGLAVDSLTYAPNIPPRPLPPSRFSFGKLRHDRRRWTAFIAVKAPGAGSFRVSATRGLSWSFLPEGTKATTLARGGRKWLKLWPAAKGPAGHRLRQRIKRSGKTSIVIHVHYTESGHSTSVGSKRLSLLRASQRDTANARQRRHSPIASPVN